MRGALETAWNIRKRFRKWLCRNCFRLQCTSIWCLRLLTSSLANLLRPKRQLFVAFARCEGGRLAPLCPFREPMGIFDEAPSLPWQLFEGKGWEVCASFTCLYTHPISTFAWPHFYWRLSKVCLSWSVGQAGRPLFTVCEHYLSDVDLFATELLQRLGSALQSRFLSSRWFHLVSTFLSYTGPHH